MFREELKAARLAAGITKPAAAALIMCPLRTYECWEDGSRVPPAYVQRDALRAITAPASISDRLATRNDSNGAPDDQTTNAAELNDLRAHIGEVYDGGFWKPITGVLWHDDEPFQLHMFQHDVEFEKAWWRVVIVEKTVFDESDLSAVNYADDVFFDAWKL